MIKLDIGCGLRKKEGYLGIDLEPSPATDVLGDIRQLPIKDDCIDEIWCNHVLEHLNEDAWQGSYEISEAVSEFARVLKDSGKAIVITPSPQSGNAVRDGHKTVYRYDWLVNIFSYYFDEVDVVGGDLGTDAWHSPFFQNSFYHVSFFWKGLQIFTKETQLQGDA